MYGNLSSVRDILIYELIECIKRQLYILLSPSHSTSNHIQTHWFANCQTCALYSLLSPTLSFRFASCIWLTIHMFHMMMCVCVCFMRIFHVNRIWLKCLLRFESPFIYSIRFITFSTFKFNGVRTWYFRSAIQMGSKGSIFFMCYAFFHSFPFLSFSFFSFCCVSFSELKRYSICCNQQKAFFIRTISSSTPQTESSIRSCCCFDAVNIQFSVAICCAVCVMMSQAWKISTTIKSRHGFPLFVWCCVNMSLSHSCQPSSSIKHLEVTRMNGKFTTNHYNKYETLTEQKNTFKYVFALFGYRMKLVDQLYKSNVRFVCDLSSSGKEGQKERKWTICKRFTINRQFLFDEHND